MPGWGLSQRLSRVVGPYCAKELSLSGNFLDAGAAGQWGLVNRVVEPDQLMPAAMRLVANMAQIPIEILATYKQIIDAGYDLTLGDALALERQLSNTHNRSATAEAGAARRRGDPGARPIAVAASLPWGSAPGGLCTGRS